MEKTNQEIASILKFRPEEAVVIKDGTESRVKADQLITGESIPVDKSVNDAVYARIMNGQGALRIVVTKGSEDTLLSRIIHMVQEAKNELPPSQLFVERFEGIYAKLVVAVALLLMIVPPFLLGWTWESTIYRAMIFLVVASPCALVSSIMPAILSGISNGARKGVLFKGGVHLEQMGQISKPKVTDILPANDYSEESLLGLAASLEYLSEHPIAKAIVEAAGSRKLLLQPATAMQAVTGLGVRGKVNEVECRIGKIGLLPDLVIDPKYLGEAERLEAEGKTVIFVEANGQFSDANGRLQNHGTRDRPACRCR
ncbi:hypothetical protein [Paenibacillus sp. BR2-3]|uniref:P-type ATPase n=1 Tax=Paenibacillus sp. BR2-3 TaxID=3048494 RepID=UPI00397737F2